MPCKGSQCPAVALCVAGGMIRPARIGKPAAGPLGLAGCAGTAGPGPAGQIVAVCFSAVLLLLVPLLFVFLLCLGGCVPLKEQVHLDPGLPRPRGRRLQFT